MIATPHEPHCAPSSAARRCLIPGCQRTMMMIRRQSVNSGIHESSNHLFYASAVPCYNLLTYDEKRELSMLNQLTHLVDRTRRNHGLEHATIHVLSERHKQFSAQGNSDFRGFHLNIYGDVAEEDVIDAVHEAHRRM